MLPDDAANHWLNQQDALNAKGLLLQPQLNLFLLQQQLCMSMQTNFLMA